MAFLAALWLPIVVSAVIVFIASSVIHMVLPIHKGDCKKLPNEADILAAMRKAGVQRGDYGLPGAASMAELSTPEMIEKFNQGPVAFMTVLPNGPMQIGKSLVQWFIYSVVISIVAGYLGYAVLGAGASYAEVFRVTGVVAVMAYAAGACPNSIWKGQGWIITAKFVFDGVVYGLLTAGTFGWLWPAASGG